MECFFPSFNGGRKRRRLIFSSSFFALLLALFFSDSAKRDQVRLSFFPSLSIAMKGPRSSFSATL